MRLIDRLEQRYGTPDLVMIGKAVIPSYREFLKALVSTSRTNSTLLDFSQTRRDDVFCLRHDVDHSIEHALIMGVIEAQMGLVSSFYLLHPGDYDSPGNYYGEIRDGRIQHSERLIEASRILSGLGHELGLHTDFVQLSVITGRSVKELLIEEIEFFRSIGVVIKGTASHGSAFARKHKFTNYEIFSDLEGSRTEGKTRAIEIAGAEIMLGAMRMDEVGLAYEAYFTPYDQYLADVGSGFSLSSRKDRTNNYEVQDYGPVLQEQLESRLALSSGAIVCLTHPEWWKVSR